MLNEELPENIDQWDIGTITKLLQAGYYESDYLEFKEDISKDNERIGRTACAFANTKGGFFIFGISDDRIKSIPERLVGLDKSKDNIAMITNQLSKIKPQLPSSKIIFKKSSIDLGKEREIILVKIKYSDFTHQFDNRFYKRLTGKNDFLTNEEI